MLPINFESYWGIFPLGIIIATVAMCAGIDGAAFWGPVLLLGFDVQPTVAVACGIFVELFGFSSGVYGYARRKNIVFKIAVPLLLFAIPFSLLGSYVSKMLNPKILTVCMGAGCIFLAVRNIQRAWHIISERTTADLHIGARLPGYFLSSIGGFFTGAIGFGIGETNAYYLLVKNRFPIAYSSGTTVFTIAVTALITSAFNILFYRQSIPADITTLFNVVLFAVPAVIIGGQIGVRLAHIVSRPFFHYSLSGIFFIIAALSIVRAVK
ncbi:MAG: sulfite exporter TauE/SafE family protein [Nitrospirae bacterium]|nr:sulfite exporter TauE/SafE family protein [Nitrospirota bacterium]